MREIFYRPVTLGPEDTVPEGSYIVENEHVVLAPVTLDEIFKEYDDELAELPEVHYG